MRVPLAIFRIAIVLLVAVGTARGDRIVLRNGSSLRGSIVSESGTEIELELEDGMRMNIRKSLIERIERTEPEPAEPEPETGADPDPVAETQPADAPPPEDHVEPVDTAAPAFFRKAPASAWDLDFGRYPVLRSAMLTRFRAYEMVEMSPLALSPSVERFGRLIREHGHGGFLAAWKFRYVGMKELRFGDQVKFIGELTSPEDPDMALIRLEGGPAPTTTRLAVFLVRRNHQTFRYATSDVFENRAFKQKDLHKLAKESLPVRTYEANYRLVTEQWASEPQRALLSGLNSAFGETPLVRLERYRFRIEWFDTPEGERPALDPSLLAREVVRPLALPGRPVATSADVRRYWGNPELNRSRLRGVLEENRKALLTFGIRPGTDYYVEEDRIGALGAKGISIETVRRFIDRATIDSLTRE